MPVYSDGSRQMYILQIKKNQSRSGRDLLWFFAFFIEKENDLITDTIYKK